MSTVYNGKAFAVIPGFPDNCPGCNESYVKWNYVNHEMISSPTNVYHSGKKEYSVGKGLAGAALFGPIGALAGVNGKKTQGYTTKEGEYSYRISAQCPKCGYFHEITSKYYPNFKMRKEDEQKRRDSAQIEPKMERLAKEISVLDIISFLESRKGRTVDDVEIYEYLKQTDHLNHLSSEQIAEVESVMGISVDKRGKDRAVAVLIHCCIQRIIERGVNVEIVGATSPCCQLYMIRKDETEIENEKVEIEKLAESLSSIIDLPSKIKEALSGGPMGRVDIYEYLKKNNDLPEEVLSAEKRAEECIDAYGDNLALDFKTTFLFKTLIDLENQKVIRSDGTKYKRITEQEKLKEKLKEKEIENLAESLSSTIDLPAKIEKALLNGPMEIIDIYEYLKANNDLPEEVLNAEKKAEECITASGGNMEVAFKMCFLFGTLCDLEDQCVVGIGSNHMEYRWFTEQERLIAKQERIKDEEIKSLAESLSSTIDLPSKIEKALLSGPMRKEDIYEKIKENNDLPKEVLSAEKKAEESIAADGGNRRDFFKYVFLYDVVRQLEDQNVICCDDYVHYRLLTEEERLKR